MATSKIGGVMSVFVLVVTGMLTWVRFEALSLDAQLVLTRLVVFFVPIPCALLFYDLTHEHGRRIRFFAALLTSAVIGLIGVGALNLSTTYHSILISHETCLASESTWRCIELTPPRYPVSLTWQLTVASRGPTGQVLWSPGFWSREWTAKARVRDPTPYDLTVLLADFKVPDRYGVSYKLAAPGDLIQSYLVDLSPNTVPVIHSGELSDLRFWFWVYGGVVWFVGSFVLSCSSWWVPKVMPKPLNATNMPG